MTFEVEILVTNRLGDLRQIAPIGASLSQKVFFSKRRSSDEGFLVIIVVVVVERGRIAHLPVSI